MWKKWAHLICEKKKQNINCIVLYKTAALKFRINDTRFSQKDGEIYF